MEKTENNDSLLVFTSKAIDYAKAHAKALGVAVAVIAVLWIGTACWLSHRENVRQESWAQYYQAQLALLQGTEQAAQMVDALEEAYPSSNAAYYGRLMMADWLFTQENYTQAAAMYEPLLQAKNKHVRMLAALSLAAAQQAMQDYAASIRTAQDFIAKNPTSFMLPQMYFTLALSQELSGDKTAALNTYKKILEDYTKTYFGVFAKDKIAALSK